MKNTCWIMQATESSQAKGASVYRAETVSSSCLCFDIGLQKAREGGHRRPLGSQAAVGVSLVALRGAKDGFGLYGGDGASSIERN